MKLFNSIQYLEEIDSTNKYLKENIPSETTIVYTFNQKLGKGRKNKSWLDKKNKSLAISFYLKPDKNIPHFFYYVATISLACINVLNKLKIKGSWIKWPNDIYIDRKKLAGILTENIYINNTISALVIGIGLNINHNEHEISKIDIPATSIFNESKISFNLTDIFNSLLTEFENMFSILFNYDLKFIFDMWINNSKILTQKIKTIIDDKEVITKIIGVNKDGSLKVLYNDKEVYVYTGKIII